MAKKLIPKKVRLAEIPDLKAIIDGSIIAYLVMPDHPDTPFGDSPLHIPDHVVAAMEKHLGAYLKDGIAPPEAIAPAIMNIADDLLAGREVSIKSGDYIGIMEYMRKGE